MCSYVAYDPPWSDLLQLLENMISRKPVISGAYCFSKSVTEILSVKCKVNCEGDTSNLIISESGKCFISGPSLCYCIYVNVLSVCIQLHYALKWTSLVTKWDFMSMNLDLQFF